MTLKPLRRFSTYSKHSRSCGAPRVVEEGDLRYLVNNGGVIGVQRIGAPEQAVFRGWVVQRTASSLRDKARNALVVGLGGGSVAQYWRNTSLSVHAVEIDGRVAKLAETHFGVTRGTTMVQDGLKFIRKRADDVRRFRELSAAPGVTFSRRGRLAALFLRSDMVSQEFSGATAAIFSSPCLSPNRKVGFLNCRLPRRVGGAVTLRPTLVPMRPPPQRGQERGQAARRAGVVRAAREGALVHEGDGREAEEEAHGRGPRGERRRDDLSDSVGKSSLIPRARAVPA